MPTYTNNTESGSTTDHILDISYIVNVYIDNIVYWLSIYTKYIGSLLTVVQPQIGYIYYP